MLGLTKSANGAGNLDLRDWPEPQPGPGEVKIAVHGAGICGTDLHIEDDEYDVTPPLILGHELGGIVVGLGSGVDGIHLGACVTAHPFVHTCGQCIYCQQGLWSLCRQKKAFGVHVNGAFAPFLTLPASIVRKVPAGVDAQSAALFEPLACCVKAVEHTTTIHAGDVAVVIGPGPIGLLTAQVAKAEGATVVVVGLPTDEQRLAVARTLGVDRALSSEDPLLPKLLRDLSQGEGADIALECSGSPSGARMALKILRKRGQFMQVGLYGKPFELDVDQFVYKDVALLTSVASSAASWDWATRLVERRLVQLKPLVSAIVPLEDWRTAFRLARARGGLKVLIDPSPDHMQVIV